MQPTADPDQRGSWGAYLERFHADRPGITERILANSRASGQDPYEWAAEPLTARPDGPTLDLACGSGPMATLLPGWVGTDLSAPELHQARLAGRMPLVRASSTRLPFRSGAATGVVCSMGLQIIDPVDEAVGELARVLHRGDRSVLLLPTNRPLGWRQALTYGRLQLALRQTIRYPNDDVLAGPRLHELAHRHGLTVVRDEQRVFHLALESGERLDEFLQSLYLPDVDPRRLDRARRVLASRIGHLLAIPLRRVILEHAQTLARSTGAP